jgi:hypothetical protein
MSISYRINPSRRRIFTYVTGSVTALEVIGHFETIRREGYQGYTELIDASNIVDPTLSVAELWNIAVALRKMQREGNFGSRAVWVGSDTNFVLANLFASLMSGLVRMRVFHDRLAAEEWLNKQSHDRSASTDSR